jgi:hypothetical protein
LGRGDDDDHHHDPFIEEMNILWDEGMNILLLRKIIIIIIMISGPGRWHWLWLGRGNDRHDFGDEGNVWDEGKYRIEGKSNV